MNDITSMTPRRAILSGGLGLAVAACATAPKLQRGDVRMTIEVQVPPNADAVYLTGNLAALGPWRPDALKMEGEGGLRRAVLLAPEGFSLEFKVTLGTWDREGVGPSGTVMPNFKATVSDGAVSRVAVTDFKKDSRVYLADPAGGGIVGDVTTWLNVSSAYLPRPRHVQVWTPPGYHDTPNKRFRVIYMHDGQNLLDPRIANTGVDWGVDEAMVRLSGRGGDPAIVVAVWSTDQRRLEYAPTKVIGALADAVRRDVELEFGGAILGDRYLQFLAEDLKPRVDAQFRTKTGAPDTMLMGSSMGGIISLYGVTERPETFGAAACLSTHWPVAISSARIVDGQATWRPILLDAYRSYFRQSALSPDRTRIWADHGTENLDRLYPAYQHAITPLFIERGFSIGHRLQLMTYQGSDHNEASWRARLDDPLHFLLAA